MDERMTETFKPYEPDDSGYDSYDDYDYPDSRPTNVLWGRVLILVIALLLAFWLGRVTAGGADDRVAELRAELTEAQQENEQLAADLEAARQEAAAPTVSPSPVPTETDEATDPVDETEGATYTVERGDTLRLIAQRLCGDPEIADEIAELNGITDATQLSVGETLTLPAGCEV